MYDLSWHRVGADRYETARRIQDTSATEFAAVIESHNGDWFLSAFTFGRPLVAPNRHDTLADAKRSAGLMFYAVESGAR